MTNQDQATQYITDRAHLTAREIFAAATNEGKNRGFLITLATALIQTGRFVI